MARGPLGRALVVLLVEDDRVDPFALADIVDLRPRELRVHVDGAKPGLGRRVGRVREPSVVAAEDRDGVAGHQAVRHPRVRQRVGAPVDVHVAERPKLVDERGPVAPADRRDGRGRPERPPSGDLATHPGHLVRARRRKDPRAGDRGRRLGRHG